MDLLAMYRGDTVKIVGKKHRYTIAVAIADEECEIGKIKMNEVMRKNLNIGIGDVIILYQCYNVKYGESVHILPMDDTIKGLTSSDLFENFLKPYFQDAFRTVRVGDLFSVRDGSMRVVEFKIVKTDPEEYCVVSPATIIYYEGDSIKREDEEARLNQAVYEVNGDVCFNFCLDEIFHNLHE